MHTSRGSDTTLVGFIMLRQLLHWGRDVVMHRDDRLRDEYWMPSLLLLPGSCRVSCSGDDLFATHVRGSATILLTETMHLLGPWSDIFIVCVLAAGSA